MAEDPIIIDDGGSTRIKKHLKEGGVGEMDLLLSVRDDVGTPAAGRPGSQDETLARGSAYGQSINIAYVDIDGNAINPPGYPMPFRSFQVVSGDRNQHQVDGDLTVSATGKDQIRITVSGPPGGDPVVEARQQKGRRRYIVSNSHRISSVVVTKPNGARDTFNVPASAIYTSVIIN